MFGFKLWSRFGSFRDPLTITQNMTLSIPPKTTVGGMLAAILGIDYNDYFCDDEFFNFKYSLILENPVRKKSFSQNYIMDYTKISLNRLNLVLKVRDRNTSLKELENQKDILVSHGKLTKAEEKKIISLEKNIKKEGVALDKAVNDLNINSSQRFTKPKPTYRELLLNPSYLIFINEFKYEEEIVEFMQNHYSEFPLYMGNSEFLANYKFIKCIKNQKKELSELDSFTIQPEKIKFEEGKKYTNLYVPLRITKGRKYRDYKNIISCDCDKRIVLTSLVEGYSITTDIGEYDCEFI